MQSTPNKVDNTAMVNGATLDMQSFSSQEPTMSMLMLATIQVFMVSESHLTTSLLPTLFVKMEVQLLSLTSGEALRISELHHLAVR